MGLADAASRLTICSYTLGVDIGFEERVRLAAEAGFAGIGLRAENYVAAKEAGLDDDAMRAVLDRYGVSVGEVEYLTAWGSDDTRDEAQQRKEQTIFQMARVFGVGHLNAGLLDRPPAEGIPAAFAGLCDRADGLTVALEFLPYGAVADLSTAWRVVSEAGRANSGVLIDMWHWARAGVQPADLDAVPVERIVAVQLCDVLEVPLEPAPSRYEALHHRLLPGRGYGDVAGTLRLLQSKGVGDVPVSVEVISDELIAMGLDVAAAEMMAAARESLATLRAHEERGASV